VIAPVMLELPFTGRWVARNSPARRVPSHGTSAFGSSHAIDFVAVDERGRTAPVTWRTFLATEPPERFQGFGQPVLAPVEGTVVLAHDGEPDHEARRSLPAGLPYLASQAQRAALGPAAIAGNHVAIEVSPGGPVVLLAHLRRGTLGVGLGDRVLAGASVAECGNSGNSTQPHLHLQVSDSAIFNAARGVPFVVRRPDGTTWLPGEGEVVTTPGW
jgi:murein DD-endopeptidase MepM/ murein hydrolase activator NlpD